MTTYLVCEGPSDGLDRRVLTLLLVQKLGRVVQIEAAGGDASLRSVARFIEERSKLRQGPRDTAFSIEDRNYHPQKCAAATWVAANARHFIWRRHEIENYLLQPAIIAATFQMWQQENRPGSAALPITGAAIWQLLRDLAQPMLEDHAGRLTLYELRGEQRHRDTRWLDPQPQQIPHTQVRERDARQLAWLDYLRQEAQRLREACRALDTDPQFTADAITRRYEHHLALILASEFLTTGQFLDDLGGHELLWRLGRFLHTRGMQLRDAALINELLRALDVIYTPELFPRDDFAALATRIPGRYQSSAHG